MQRNRIRKTKEKLTFIKTLVLKSVKVDKMQKLDAGQYRQLI